MSKITFFIAATALVFTVGVTQAEKAFAEPGFNCPAGEYLPPGGGTYPHIHCTKKFVTLSKTHTDHINIIPNNTDACNTKRQNARDYIMGLTVIDPARRNAIMTYLNGNDIWCK